MIVNRDKLIKKIKKVYPFNQADDDQIASLGDKSEVVFFKSGDMIYIEGAAAKYLYIIFEGQVEILKEQNQTIIKKNHLYMGDFFGEDVFLDKKLRQTSARALEDSLLIRINIAAISVFLRSNPNVQTHFPPLVNSYKLLVKNKQNLELEQESLYYLGQPHKLYLVSKAFFLFLLASIGSVGIFYLSSVKIFSGTAASIGIAMVFAVYLVWFFWNFFEWANDLYFFTDRRVINQERGLILYESREETPLDAIISLSSRMNILGRQFGFGDLFIKTYTGSLCLKNVPDIASAQNFVEFLIEKNTANKHLNDKKDFENLMRDRLGLEQTSAIESEPDPSHTYKPGRNVNGRPANFFNRLFGTRRMEGETVIYRTHWVFLMQKTILPLLIFLSLISVLLYLRANTFAIAYNQAFLTILSIIGLASAFWWLYQYLDWRNDQYMITPEQIIDLYRKPLGLEDKRAAPLENIQSIRYKRQGLLGLMLNYGTVYVKVGNEDFTFDDVFNPLGIQQTLFAYLERANLLEKKTNLAEQQRQVADWIDAYQRFSNEKPQDD